jgi:hypothetical protein
VEKQGYRRELFTTGKGGDIGAGGGGLWLGLESLQERMYERRQRRAFDLILRSISPNPYLNRSALL